MTFVRYESFKWQQEVPGARWFRADFHIHTLDDHPCSNLTWPTGLSGDPSSEPVQQQYAIRFLKAAIAKGIQVLGLTPHSIKSGSTDLTSATWKIVEVWNTENDDDGIPFRDKIFAIFPGFEPSLTDGSEGLHLLFLFDPEIGRETYIGAFNSIMGGLQPWSGNNLRISPNDASKAFSILEDLHKRESEGKWNYLCLGAHAFSSKGIFNSLKSQVLQWFMHHCVSALELKDDELPEEALASKTWLRDGLSKNMQALFHSSDAYRVEDIGKRSSLIKLATPRIESVRQAFLASESRLRICYVRGSAGLEEASDLPESIPSRRPWLQSIQIKGGTSFFAGNDAHTGNPREVTINLSPDLTCIIGGRMSGKSTLLDGMRVLTGLELPKDAELLTNVKERAQNKFLSGRPVVKMNVRGPKNPALPIAERWPGKFYTQRELQTGIRDQEKIKLILYSLKQELSALLIGNDNEIKVIDRKLSALVAIIETKREIYSEAEEEAKSISASQEALNRFTEAGIASLTNAQSVVGKIDSLSQVLSDLTAQHDEVNNNQNNLVEFNYAEDLVDALSGTDIKPPFDILTKRLVSTSRYRRLILKKMQNTLSLAKSAGLQTVENKRREVETALIGSGGSAEDLNRFAELVDAVASVEVIELARQNAKEDFIRSIREFAKLRSQRRKLIKQNDEMIEQVLQWVSGKFPNHIRIGVQKNGDYTELEKWISTLRDGGITRWWNNNKEQLLAPDKVRQALNKRQFSLIGMSEQVGHTFATLVTPAKSLELGSLKGNNKYSIELRVAETGNVFRDIIHLSGGAQISVLLTLILATEDNLPLIIDQPEDEIDKAYLFDVMLPSLRSLKGKKQIILATHDANIVVNGDADFVIYLTADSDQCKIQSSGSIEEMPVKNAIVKILDGGEDAFALRRAKYGF